MVIHPRVAHLIRVDEDGHWIWTANKHKKHGYGQVTDRGTKPAHRFVWELHRGPIPEGLVIDHLCRVRECVNPDHLEPVPPRENAHRGMAPNIITWRTGICQRGHEMNGRNLITIVRKDGRVQHQCRECWNLNRKRRASESRG